MTEEEARVIALSMIPTASEPLTLGELEQYLQKAANLLRGSIDQADFKAHIFPLMFFKRISDVYLAEHGHALAESDGDHEFAAFAENRRFAIPAGCLWEDVRARTENIAQALVTAFENRIQLRLPRQNDADATGWVCRAGDEPHPRAAGGANGRSPRIA